MEEDKRYRTGGIVGTIVFHAIVLFGLLFLALRTPLPLPGEEGVEVSLGYADAGRGLSQPEKIQPLQRIEPKLPEPEPGEIIHQDFEEAPTLEEEIKEEEIPEVVEEKPVEETVEEQKVNINAIYTPHEQDQEESGTQGNSQNPADQGNLSGSNQTNKPEGVSREGTGISFDLEGRGSIHLPKPAYESMEQGKVVVTIWVNKEGKVVRAIEGAQGTTITDLNLRALARDAALNASFTPDPNAPDTQKGTITYNFLRRN